MSITNRGNSTFVIFAILYVFKSKVVASNSLLILGSADALWDLLQTDVVQIQAYDATDHTIWCATDISRRDCRLRIRVWFRWLFCQPSGLKSLYPSGMLFYSLGLFETIAGETSAVVHGLFMMPFLFLSIPQSICDEFSGHRLVQHSTSLIFSSVAIVSVV